MGHPKKPRKQYDTPSHPWNADRIKEENRLASKYGLKRTLVIGLVIYIAGALFSGFSINEVITDADSQSAYMIL